MARGYKEFEAGFHSLSIGVDAVIFFIAPQSARFATIVRVGGQVETSYPIVIALHDLATIEVREGPVEVFYEFMADNEKQAAIIRERSGLLHDDEKEHTAEIYAVIVDFRDRG
jgi:hypothetical protein